MAEVNPFFSIVMPLYNAERFVSQAIESVKSQTFEGWELIIVDDCSSDNSIRIAKECAGTDSRILIERMAENSGTAYLPRKGAIEKAKGNWIVELDADDYLSLDYLSGIKKTIEKSAPDIVLSRTEFIDKKGKTYKKLPTEDFDIISSYTGKELIKYTIDWKVSTAGEAVKRGLYKAIVDKRSESEHLIYYDEIITRYLLLQAQKVAFSECTYYYRKNIESITHKSGVHLQQIDIAFLLENLINNNFTKDSEEEKVLNAYKIEIIYSVLNNLDKSGLDDKEKKEILKKVILLHDSLDIKQLKGWKSKLFSKIPISILRPLVNLHAIGKSGK